MSPLYVTAALSAPDSPSSCPAGPCCSRSARPSSVVPFAWLASMLHTALVWHLVLPMVCMQGWVTSAFWGRRMNNPVYSIHRQRCVCAGASTELVHTTDIAASVVAIMNLIFA